MWQVRGRREVGKTEGKRPLGRPRRRWEVNIKMNLKELCCEEWNGQLAGFCEHGNESWGNVKCGE
jgi:hypothetical protein